MEARGTSDIKIPVLLKPRDFNKLRITIVVWDSACPPEPLLCFAMVLYYLLWNYRSRGDATAAGAGGITYHSQKRALRKIV